MSVILFIDTTAMNTAKVALTVNGKRYEKSGESKVLKSQTVLPLIEELLHLAHLRIRDITEIRVATGPGSFTGLRVGASIANALSYLIGIPVNGRKALVIPTY